jgi:acetyl-CoA carboxylase biotin carboxylase subunit
MGIATAAVYSECDRSALHVRLADERVCIGPPSVRESYLNIPVIVSAALSFGADAVHPGYGFLSENGDFAEACQRSGLTFIGPRVRNIRLMGDKPRARRIMEKAGVPVLPGTSAGTTDVSEAQAVAAQIGFPVLLKAAAGGGGRGLRIAATPEELASVFAIAEEEGANAFGNGALYVEKYLENPRHIEFQIAADQHRNIIHLGERECSIQRRYQKIIEEAPSVAMTKRLRERMGAAAIKAARAIGYTNVGTVEFLLDQQGHFYFIEMNTRVQVEHPVTEMITGIDIVQEQIRIASGEKLRFRQRDVMLSGHAIECRINAEDPFKFTPSPGRITSWHVPGGPGVRVDSHSYAGYFVPPNYDSMIGKVITYGATREQAIRRMQIALSEMVVEGISTNIPLHRELMVDARFIEGGTNIHYLEQRLAEMPKAGK